MCLWLQCCMHNKHQGHRGLAESLRLCLENAARVGWVNKWLKLSLSTKWDEILLNPQAKGGKTGGNHNNTFSLKLRVLNTSTSQEEEEELSLRFRCFAVTWSTLRCQWEGQSAGWRWTVSSAQMDTPWLRHAWPIPTANCVILYTRSPRLSDGWVY